MFVVVVVMSLFVCHSETDFASFFLLYYYFVCFFWSHCCVVNLLRTIVGVLGPLTGVGTTRHGMDDLPSRTNIQVWYLGPKIMDDHTRAPPRVRSHGCSDYPLGFRFTPATIAVSY